MVDRAKVYFRCTDGERAVFEGAIKLAMVFHQFLGVPLSRATAPSLEKAIEEAVRLQPWVEDVRVRIDRRMLGKGGRRYGYTTLDGRMLRLDVVTRYRTARAEVAMEFVRNMEYPLMFVRMVENRAVKKVYSRKPISDAIESGSRGKRRDHR